MSTHSPANPVVSPSFAFALGAATTCLLTIAGPSLGKVARPALVRIFKKGIRVGRAVRGKVERVGADLSDTYAQARQELEAEEREL